MYRNQCGFLMSFQDPMLSKAAVANLLGCCERSLERKVRDGQFPPALRFGKESLWFESVLHGWLEAKRGEQQAWKPRKTPRAAKTQKTSASPSPTSEVATDPRSSQVFTHEELSRIGHRISLDECAVPVSPGRADDSCIKPTLVGG